MLKVDLEFIVHRLNVDPLYPFKKKRPKRSAKPHTKFVKEEVEKLRQARAKDPFPIPKIDKLVDATYGHPRMSFLDVFQGYHHITLAPGDEEKTFFISLEGNYHYTFMPFGLKNAVVTYQRMVTWMFRLQIGKTMEVYIDEMVVKSK